MCKLYHFNAVTQATEICCIGAQRCSWGGDNAHYATADEARLRGIMLSQASPEGLPELLEEQRYVYRTEPLQHELTAPASDFALMRPETLPAPEAVLLASPTLLAAQQLTHGHEAIHALPVDAATARVFPAMYFALWSKGELSESRRFCYAERYWASSMPLAVWHRWASLATPAPGTWEVLVSKYEVGLPLTLPARSLTPQTTFSDFLPKPRRTLRERIFSRRTGLRLEPVA